MNMRILLLALLASAALPAAPAAAQAAAQQTQTITGTRLDLSTTGEVTRVPDLANISAGVVTRASTAAAALKENAEKMDRVITALKQAGIADRDIQTSSINLNAEYRYPQNQAPQLTGYTASNQVTIRFRDIAASGKVTSRTKLDGAMFPRAALCALAWNAGRPGRLGE